LADETAKTALIFDASGAQKGAADFVASSQKVIAAEQAVQAAAEKSATGVDAAEVKKAAARARGASGAKDQAVVEAAAAKAGADAVVTSNDRIVKSTVQQQALLDRYARSWDPLVGAVQRAARQLDVLNDIAAKTSGAVQTRALEMAAQAADRLTVAQKNLATGTKTVGDSVYNARFATQQLGVQTVQFFSSLQAGQPFLQAFIGQAHQVVDVALATGTGFKTLAAGVGSMFASVGRWIAANPLVTIFAAATVALAALGAMAESTARRLEATRNVLSGVRDDYLAASAAAEQLAKSLAATTTLSTAQSREASQTLFQGGFTGTLDQGKAIVQVFADLSKVLGETTPNWKRMGDAMRDPAGVMQQLLDQNHLKGLNQVLVDNAKRMQDAGNYAGAAAELMKALARETANVTDNQTPLQTALKKLEDAFTKTGQAGRSFADTIGTAMTNAAAAVINFTASMIPYLQRFFDHLAGRGNIATATGNFTPFLSTDQQKLLAAPGAVPTVLSSAGAAGIMQLMPGTAAGLGVNPFIPTENVKGGLQYIQQLAAQMQNFPGGTEEGVTRAYLTGPHGNVMSGAATAYSEKVAGADVSKLPTETSAMIDYWGKVLNLPPNLIALGKRIATVESGGVQGPTNATQAFVAPPGAVPTVPVAPTAKTPAEVAAAGLTTPDAYREILKQAQEYTKGLGLLGDKQNTIAGQQKVLQQALALSFTTGDYASVAKYSAGLLALQGQQYQAISPQQEFIKNLKQQAETAQIVTEGDRKLAEALQQLNELNKQHPDTASEAERSQVINAVLEQQSGAYKQLTHDTELQIAQQDALTVAYGEGYAAVAKATAATQAYNDAIKLFPAGTQRQAAIESLTQQNLQRAASAQGTAAAQQSLQNKDTLTTIQAETDTLLENNTQRTLYLAHLKDEMDAKRLLPNVSEEVRQKYVQEADAIAAATLELQRQQNALAAISGAFESAFDTIGNSITQALLQGQGAAVNWRNIMTSVAQQVLQAFLKLAVLNPILNNLFGGNRSTITDVFDTLNKTTPGSSTSSDSSGGFAGSLIGLALKGIGLIGGGVGSASYDPGLYGAVGDISGLTPGGAALQGAGGLPPLFTPLPAHHAGGIVGSNDNLPMSLFPTAMIAGLPRFHGGLGGNEFAAILQRGERVLTERQQQQVQAAAGGGGDTVSISIDARNSTPEAVNSFRRSLPQIAGIMSDQMTKAKMRNR